MVQYNLKIIYGFAERLSKRANRTVATHVTLWASFGGIGGLVVTLWLHAEEESAGVVGLLFLLIFGAIGFLRGREKAFELRLHAQTVLCQVKIEENTRLPHAM